LLTPEDEIKGLLKSKNGSATGVGLG